MPDGIPLAKNACALPDDIARSVNMPNASTQEITLLINHFSKLIEGPNILNRRLEKKVYTETFHGRDFPWMIYASAPPITIDNTLEVWDDPTGLFTDTDLKLTINEDFYLKSGGPNVGNVAVRKAYYKFSADMGNIRLKYNGGLVKNEPESGTVIIPDDLRGACIAQVSAWWQKSQNPSIKFQIVQGIHTGFDSYSFLPAVREILLARKRAVF